MIPVPGVSEPSAEGSGDGFLRLKGQKERARGAKRTILSPGKSTGVLLIRINP